MRQKRFRGMLGILMSVLMILSSLMPSFSVRAEETTDEAEETTEQVTEEKFNIPSYREPATEVWIYDERNDKAVILDESHPVWKKVAYFDASNGELVITEYRSLLGMGFKIPGTGDGYETYAKIYADGELTVVTDKIQILSQLGDGEKEPYGSCGIYTTRGLKIQTYIDDTTGRKILQKGGLNKLLTNITSADEFELTVEAGPATDTSVGIYTPNYAEKYQNTGKKSVTVKTTGGVVTGDGGVSIGLKCNSIQTGPEVQTEGTEGGRAGLEAAGGTSPFTSTGILITQSDLGDEVDQFDRSDVTTKGGKAGHYSLGLVYGKPGRSFWILSSSLTACSGEGGVSAIEANAGIYVTGGYIYVGSGSIKSGKESHALPMESSVRADGTASKFGRGIITLNEGHVEMNYREDISTIIAEGTLGAVKGSVTGVAILKGDNATDKELISEATYTDTEGTGAKYVEVRNKPLSEKSAYTGYMLVAETDKDIDISDMFETVRTVTLKATSVSYNGVASDKVNVTFDKVNKKAKINVTVDPKTRGDHVDVRVVMSGGNITRTKDIRLNIFNALPKEVTINQKSIQYGKELPLPLASDGGMLIEVTAEDLSYTGTDCYGNAYSDTEAPTLPGEYTVFFAKSTDEAEYYGHDLFTIDPGNISDAVITYADEQEVYTGASRPVKISSVKIGETELLADTDYVFKSGNTVSDVEDTTLVITGIGKYCGECTAASAWKLKKAASNTSLVRLKDYMTSWNGKPVNAEALPANGVRGLGEISISYKDPEGEELSGNLSKIGNYEVYVTIAEGQNYLAMVEKTRLGNFTLHKGTDPMEVIGEPVVQTGKTIDLKEFVYYNVGELRFSGSGDHGTSVTEDGIFTAGDEAASVTAYVMAYASEYYNAHSQAIDITVTDKEIKGLEVKMADYRAGQAAPTPVYKLPGDAVGNVKYTGKDTDGVSYSNTTAPSRPGYYTVMVSFEDTDAYYSGKASFRIYANDYYVVRFDLNGRGEVIENQDVLEGDKAEEPEKPLAEDFAFDGWYEDAGLTSAYDFNKPVLSDITLYAKWVDEIKVVTAPVAKTGLVYNGTAQELVTAGVAGKGEMNYALGADAVAAPAEGWSAAVSVATDAGEYFVWYKAVKGDKATAAECVSVNIAKAVPRLENEPQAEKKIIFDGREKLLVDPAVKAPEGCSVEYSLDGKDYSAAVPKKTDRGTYSVYYRVKGSKNYTDADAKKVRVDIVLADGDVVVNIPGLSVSDNSTVEVVLTTPRESVSYNGKKHVAVSTTLSEKQKKSQAADLDIMVLGLSDFYTVKYTYKNNVNASADKPCYFIQIKVNKKSAEYAKLDKKQKSALNKAVKAANRTLKKSKVRFAIGARSLESFKFVSVDDKAMTFRDAEGNVLSAGLKRTKKGVKIRNVKLTYGTKTFTVSKKQISRSIEASGDGFTVTLEGAGNYSGKIIQRGK